MKQLAMYLQNYLNLHQLTLIHRLSQVLYLYFTLLAALLCNNFVPVLLGVQN